MSERLERIGADRDKALKKRDEWDAKYKELDRKYKEQENCEIQTMVHAANLTPDQLAQIIALANQGILGVSMEDQEQEHQKQEDEDRMYEDRKEEKTNVWEAGDKENYEDEV